MRISKSTGIQIIKFATAAIFLYLLLKIVLIPIITSEGFREFTVNLGILGYLIIIGYAVLTEVLAPLAGAPALVLGVSIYGFGTSMLLFYIAGLISATINFYISRLYGRNLVVKLAGKKSMVEIDEFTKAEGKEVLILSRIFGFPVFEFISYAAGLTNIKFKEYITVTALASIIPNIFFYVIFRNVDFESETGVMLWLGSIVVAGIIFTFLLRSYLQRKKRIAK